MDSGLSRTRVWKADVCLWAVLQSSANAFPAQHLEGMPGRAKGALFSLGQTHTLPLLTSSASRSQQVIPLRDCAYYGGVQSCPLNIYNGQHFTTYIVSILSFLSVRHVFPFRSFGLLRGG
jgi:hypothetical protein